MLNVSEEIKSKFTRGSSHKDIRIHFMSGKHSDIYNDQIVLNSVKFNESICSRSEFKVGLCEANTFQCEVVDVPNVRKEIIRVDLEEWGQRMNHIDYISIPNQSVEMRIAQNGNTFAQSAEVLIDLLQPYCRTSFFPNIEFDYEIREFKGTYWDEATEEWIGADVPVSFPITDFEITSYDSFGEACSGTEDEYNTGHLKLMLNSRNLEERRVFLYADKYWIEDLPENVYLIVKFKNFKVVPRADWGRNVIPYGYFKIDSCKRQSDFRRRKISAIGLTVNDNNEVEEAKRLFPSATNTPYEYNPILALMSTLPYADLSKAVRYTGRSRNVTDTYQYTIGDITYTMRFEYVGAEFHDNNSVYVFRYKNKGDLNSIYEDAVWNLNLICGPLPEQVKTEWLRIVKKYIKGIYIHMWDRTNNDYYVSVKKDTIYPYFSVGNGAGNMWCSLITRVTFGRSEITTGYYANRTTTFREPQFINVFELDTSKIPDVKTSIKRLLDKKTKRYICPTDLDVPIKEQAESALELAGLFGRVGRNGNFEVIDINKMAGLYPSGILNPSNYIYPSGTDDTAVLSKYMSAWYDDELSKPYGRISCECTVKEGSNTVNAYVYIDIIDDYEDNMDDYQEYSLTNNYTIKNMVYTFDSISEILQKVANKIKQIRYMPADIKALGKPWLEAGDTITVQTQEGGYIYTIIFNRTLSGEQLLTDSIKSS